MEGGGTEEWRGEKSEERRKDGWRNERGEEGRIFTILVKIFPGTVSKVTILKLFLVKHSHRLMVITKSMGH